MLLKDLIDLSPDDKQPITTLLRKCIVLAHQLKNDRLRIWANEATRMMINTTRHEAVQLFGETEVWNTEVYSLTKGQYSSRVTSLSGKGKAWSFTPPSEQIEKAKWIDT